MSATVDAKPMIKTAPPPLAKADPCVLVIFGATGDLTRRKLIPAFSTWLARAVCRRHSACWESAAPL